MTGRRLYDHFTDSLCEHQQFTTALPEKPLAWSHLSYGDRRVWNDVARSITPKPRRSS